VKRFGEVLGLEPGRLDEYKKHHAEIWPEIAAAIHAAGIRNYSIYYRDGQLFGYYEYHGPDDEFEARMQLIADAPRMKEWWDLMGSMQIPDPDRAPGSWWSPMEEVFHLD
jgi:L-rhamnose mutarotase